MTVENLRTRPLDIKRQIEIESIPITCISSNLRRDVDFSSTKVVFGRGQEGDLVLVQALSNNGSTVHVEDKNGNEHRILKGNYFVGVLANRHSGTSESGNIPQEGLLIHQGKILNLLSVGGVIGIASGKPPQKTQDPLPLNPLGLLEKEGRRLNIAKICGPWDDEMRPSAPIVLVCGTSAEVGKTTTASSMVKAFNKMADTAVAGAKLTGTGRTRDIRKIEKAGAYPAMDFPDVGLATTYTLNAEGFLKATYTLLNRINSKKPNIIIAEAGGDPIEANVPTLLANKNFMQYVNSIVIVAGDVMGMIGMVSFLDRYISKTKLFLVYPKDRNPVTTLERVKHELPGLPIFNSLDEAETNEITKGILQLKKQPIQFPLSLGIKAA